MNHADFLALLGEHTTCVRAAFDGRASSGPTARDLFFSLVFNTRKLERIHYALVAPYSPTSFPNVVAEPRRVVEVEELPPSTFEAFKTRIRYDTPILEAAHAANHLSVVWAWMTIEVLAQDGFVGALNAHPQSANAAWLELAGKKMKETTSEEARFGKVGSLLDDKIVSFSRSSSIAAAFAPAFDVSLDDMVADEDLFALQKARNLVAHRGGLVDQQFLDDTKGRFRGEVGQPIAFTTGELAPLLRAGVKWSLHLLGIVDEWERRVDPDSLVPLSPFD